MNRIGALALRSTFRIRPRRVQGPSQTQRQAFHRTRALRDDNDRPKDNTLPTAAASPSEPPSTFQSSLEVPANEIRDISAADTKVSHKATAHNSAKSGSSSEDFSDDLEFLKAFLERDEANPNKPLTTDEAAVVKRLANRPPAALMDLFNTAISAAEAEADFKIEEILANVQDDIGRVPEPPPLTANEEGLMAMGEDIDEQFPDEPYEGDDITSLAHAQLDQHRDLRHYMRIIAWEMPQLSKLAKPFELPSRDRPLRFRYTTYMGESHPAENKVVVEFCTADLPLTPAQRLKLIKLVGPRYNPQTDEIKMSCESFSSQAQNKRYLGDLVGTLMRVAKGEGDSLEAKDSFADVPVDFRHVKWKKRPEFPETWKLTPDRKKALAERRAELKAEKQRRLEEGGVVDGLKAIEESYAVLSPVREQREQAGRTLQGRVDRMQSRGRPDLRIA